MKKAFVTTLAAAALAACFLLPGCKPEPKVIVDGQPGQDSIPVRGDWARIYHYDDPDGLHPYNTASGAAYNVKENIYMNLMDRDPQTLAPRPTLAVGPAQVSEDGLRFTFEMRPEATWDNGDPVTGHDFAFSVKCIKNPLSKGAAAASAYGFIQDVQVDPQNQKRFTVLIAEPHFQAEPSIADLFIISRKFYDSLDAMAAYTVPEFSSKQAEIMKDPTIIAFTARFNSDAFTNDPAHIYGSGPYRVESWTRGDNVTLVRKTDWWGDKLGDHPLYFPAGLDKIIFKTIVDKSVLPNAVKNGELDVVKDMIPEDFIAAREDSNGFIAQNYHLYEPAGYGYNYIGFNCRPTGTRKPFMADPKVRQAVSHLIDIEGIIENIYYGSALRQVGPISPLKKDEYDASLQGFPFDPAKAAQLLDEAGWTDTDGDGVRDKVIAGKRIALEPEILVSNANENSQRIARMVADQAQKVGMRIVVNPVAFSLIGDKMRAHNFDMAMSGWGGNPIPTDLEQNWASTNWANNGSNFFGFGDPSTDSLIAEIKRTPSAAARTPLYHTFQRKWLEQLPMVVLLAPSGRLWIHKRFRNAQPTPLQPTYKVFGFWVPKGEQKFK